MQARNATHLTRHATPANDTQEAPTQKQHSISSTMAACKLTRQAPPCRARRALLERQSGPTTRSCTASSTTPCSSSLRPHLHHVATPPLPQHRRHARLAPHLAHAHATITCKLMHGRCCRAVASSPPLSFVRTPPGHHTSPCLAGLPTRTTHRGSQRRRCLSTTAAAALLPAALRRAMPHSGRHY
jgi:hypothetical protein